MNSDRPDVLPLPRGARASLDLDRPLLGLLIFISVLCQKPLAHAINVLQHTAFEGTPRYVAGAMVGLVGFAVVWNGLKRPELQATVCGFVGGALIWMGWFEHGFEFFAHALAIPPLVQDGVQRLSPNLLLIEATLVPYLAILILFGANRETRCRMLMWFHRNLRLTPDRPTSGYRRSYAWVTALEIIFVGWFFYLTIILLYDPRILGKEHPGTYAAFVVILVWAVYLLSRLLRYNEPAPAIRYAIPTANAFWLLVEMASHWHWFTEIWIKPIQYPVGNLLILAVFIAGGILILRQRSVAFPSASSP
jgi:hypothetical protein